MPTHGKGGAVMTKKDYIKIAAILYRADWPEDQRNTIEAVARRFAIMLQGDNPNFDKGRFLKACAAE